MYWHEHSYSLGITIACTLHVHVPCTMRCAVQPLSLPSSLYLVLCVDMSSLSQEDLSYLCMSILSCYHQSSATLLTREESGMEHYDYCSLFGADTCTHTTHNPLQCSLRVMLLHIEVREIQFRPGPLTTNKAARLVHVTLCILPSQIHREGSLMKVESAVTAAAFSNA